MRSSDSGDVIVGATCGQEVAGEGGDVQAHSGDVWIRDRVGVIA